jgi:uncharacterized protein (DUF983 family)
MQQPPRHTTKKSPILAGMQTLCQSCGATIAYWRYRDAKTKGMTPLCPKCLEKLRKC